MWTYSSFRIARRNTSAGNREPAYSDFATPYLNLANAVPKAFTSSSASGGAVIRLGNSGAPPPNVTDATNTIISSSNP
jgi:hypothetical protein